jgi:hypothetical protein
VLAIFSYPSRQAAEGSWRGSSDAMPLGWCSFPSASRSNAASTRCVLAIRTRSTRSRYRVLGSHRVCYHDIYRKGLEHLVARVCRNPEYPPCRLTGQRSTRSYVEIEEVSDIGIGSFPKVVDGLLKCT